MYIELYIDYNEEPTVVMTKEDLLALLYEAGGLPPVLAVLED